MTIALKPLLALYGGGFTKGLSVHMGDGCTIALAAINGFVMKENITRVDNLCGRTVTQYL